MSSWVASRLTEVLGFSDSATAKFVVAAKIGVRELERRFNLVWDAREAFEKVCAAERSATVQLLKRHARVSLSCIKQKKWSEARRAVKLGESLCGGRLFLVPTFAATVRLAQEKLPPKIVSRIVVVVVEVKGGDRSNRTRSSPPK